MNRSFLKNLLKFYDEYKSIKVGEEHIFSETRDLFIAAYYAFLKEHAADFSRAAGLLKQAGLPAKKAVHITREKEGHYSMLIKYKDGAHLLENLEQFFLDKEGVYNPKGYYDEETVAKFNQEIFALFEMIIQKMTREDNI